MKQIDLNKFDFNFCIEFEEIFLDNKISPLTLSCFMGRIDIVKFIL